MINPEVKSRINKVDFELKKYFENVYIKDKFYKTGFFEILANRPVYLKETSEYKRLEAKVIINQPDLLMDEIKWSYSTNPMNENALWIDRVSNFDLLSQDIINIVAEKRLDEDYIFNLESIVEAINEQYIETIEEESKISKQGEIVNVLKKYGIKAEISQEMIMSNENSFLNPSDRILTINHSNDIKVSDKFKIESEVKLIEGVSWILFKDGVIDVCWTPETV